MRSSIEGLGLVPPGVVVEHQDVGADRILVSGRLASLESGCPACGTLSRSCHSRYVRTLADLPVGGRAVAILLAVPRFRCATPRLSPPDIQRRRWWTDWQEVSAQRFRSEFAAKTARLHAAKVPPVKNREVLRLTSVMRLSCVYAEFGASVGRSQRLGRYAQRR